MANEKLHVEPEDVRFRCTCATARERRTRGCATRDQAMETRWTWTDRVMLLVPRKRARFGRRGRSDGPATCAWEPWTEWRHLECRNVGCTHTSWMLWHDG
eukprot:scaffold2639_cov361-Pavlova_lutheri.AAC.28